MRKRTVALLIAFVLGLVIGAAAAVSAQLPERKTVITLNAPAGTFAKTVMSTEVGLNVVGKRNGRVVGHLMAKVDGKWVEVQLATENVLATP